VDSGLIQDYMTFSSVTIPSFNIDEVYEKCLTWCKKWGFKITESNKPTLIIAVGRINIYEFNFDKCKTIIQLSMESRNVKLDFSLIKTDSKGNQSKGSVSSFPIVAKSLYIWLRVNITDNVLRGLYPRHYLIKYIRHYSLYLGIYSLITAIFIIYGYYNEYFILVRGDVFKYFIIAIYPFFSGLHAFIELYVLKSLEKRLYVNFNQVIGLN